MLEAMRRGARTITAVKMMTRAGTGRCQGGFCCSGLQEYMHRFIEQAYRVFAEPGLYSQRLRYTRPGEMNEMKIKAEQIRNMPGLYERVTDIQPV